MYQLKKIAGLEVVEITGHKNAPTVVLLHGYGADAQDLAPISSVLKMPIGTNWLIPNGPLEIPTGGYGSGHAWAPINLEEIQKAMMQGRPRDLSSEKPAELFTSQKMLNEMLIELGVNVEKTIFAGFSQGAMLATQMAMTSAVQPLGLVVLSGSLINGDAWDQAMENRRGFRYFQSHGKQDSVLSIEGALKLNAMFKKHGLDGELQAFDGGHEIPPEVLFGVQKYLLKLFPEADWK